MNILNQSMRLGVGLSVCLLASSLARLSAQDLRYIQPKGQWQVGLEQQFVQTDQVYLSTYEQASLPTLRRYLADVTLQLGISQRVTLTARVGALRVQSFNRQVGATTGNELFAGDSLTATGDHEIGVAVLLHTWGRLHLSAYGRVGIPSGVDIRSSSLLTGDGEWDLAFGGQLLREAGSSRWAWGAEAGLRLRTRGYASDIQYSLWSGYSLTKALLVRVRTRGQQTLYDTPYYNEDGVEIGGLRGLHANLESFYTLEPSLRLGFGAQGRWSVEPGVAITVAGASTLKAISPFLIARLQLGAR